MSRSQISIAGTAIQNNFPRAHTTDCTVWHDFKIKKPLLQDDCKAAVRWKHGRPAIAVRLQLSRTAAIQSCGHCKTAADTSWNYCASPSRYWQHLFAHRVLLQHIIAPWLPLKSCKHRTDIARGLHQAGTIPRDVASPPPTLQFKKKMLNSSLDCLGSPRQQQQLSQLAP
jgi:hypothetical protein